MRAKKLRREILRKLFHLYQLPMIIGYVVLRYYFSERIAVFAIVILLMIILEYEFLRLNFNIKVPDPFGIMRPHEKKSVSGMLYIVLSTIVVFTVFDFRIAITALLITVFGDLASALIGIKYGKHKIKTGKTWEGMTAGLVMNLIVAFVFLWEYPLIAISMAFVGSIVEFLTYKLDDNLTVPISSAFAGHTVAFILGISLVQLTNPITDLYQFLTSFF